MANKKTNALNSEKENKAPTTEKARKETLNEKRLATRRSIEDYLDEKRQRSLYGHIDELDY